MGLRVCCYHAASVSFLLRYSSRIAALVIVSLLPLLSETAIPTPHVFCLALCFILVTTTQDLIFEGL